MHSHFAYRIYFVEVHKVSFVEGPPSWSRPVEFLRSGIPLLGIVANTTLLNNFLSVAIEGVTVRAGRIYFKFDRRFPA